MGTVHNSQILSQKGIREYSRREAHEVMHSISYLPDRVLFLHNSQLLQNFRSCIPFITGVVFDSLGILNINAVYAKEHRYCIPPYHSAPLF